MKQEFTRSFFVCILLLFVVSNFISPVFAEEVITEVSQYNNDDVKEKQIEDSETDDNEEEIHGEENAQDAESEGGHGEEKVIQLTPVYVITGSLVGLGLLLLVYVLFG